MTTGILSAIGGLGVFLLGMIVMTDGLKAIAGNALRKALARFTKSPTSGAISGAIATALIQSSSATTVTAVGFVGAGLITFTQALGIIFGANIGTTITGWLVAILGFKLKIGMMALPFILVGVLMHLFLRRRWAAIGFSLAGFGLIFVGIGLIQDGMAGLEGIVTPESFPGNDLAGRMLLLLLGIAITLVTQSSSAGVAAALAAVNAGTINFEQAAMMVIGMNVGTTATAALATIGGTTDVRRTGYAHVIFNVLTGVIAFLLVTPYTKACAHFFPELFRGSPEIALVGFHTFFNLLGVILVLPFSKAFERLMIWLVPAQPLKHTQRLDRSLYENPAVALDAVQATLQELATIVLNQLAQILKSGQSDRIKDALVDANEALKETRDYLTHIDASGLNENLYSPKLAAIHTIDHLRRLIDRCQESKRSQRTRKEELKPLGGVLLDAVWRAIAQIQEQIELSTPDERDQQEVTSTIKRLEEVWRAFDVQADQHRRSFIADAAGGKADTFATIRKLDTLRWIRRVSYHVWRIVYYLSGGQPDEQTYELPPLEADQTPTPETPDD